jgi:HSP20 family protein
MPFRPPRAGFSVARRLSERARAARPADPPVAAPGGFAGMVDALRGLVEQLAETGRSQSEAQTGAGENKTSLVFGYTFRMGNDGVAAEPFGNVPDPGGRPAEKAQTEPRGKAVAPATRQPIVDMFEDGDVIVVVAELPGAAPDNINCKVEGTTLLIEAGGIQHYRKQLTLPGPVQPEEFPQSFRNGILEVRLRRQTGA